MEALFNFHNAHGREFVEAVARRHDSRTHRDTMERQCHDFATNLIGNLPAPKAKNQEAEAGYWEGLLTQVEALLG
jgi:hypothetical protein